MTLKTSSLSRGGWSWSGGDFAADAKGRASRANEHVTEWLEGRADALEEGWSFDVRPVGTGDLELRVAIEGVEFVRKGADAIHLHSTSGAIRFGHATWVDAQGRATIVPTDWVRGELRMRVPEAVVEASAYPAVLDPSLGPETATDPGVYGPDDQDSSNLGAACTANVCLVAYANASGVQIRRYTTAGVALSPYPQPIGAGYGAAVGAMANRFLVVRYVSALGTFADVFDESGVNVGTTVKVTTFGSPSNPACNANECLLAWGQNGPNQTDGMRIDNMGASLDPFGFVIDGVASNGINVAFNGTNFLVSYNASAKRIDPSGLVLDPAPIVLGSPTDSATGIASNGTDFLAAMSHSSGGRWVVPVHADGSLGGSTSSPLSYSNGVVWTGDRYLEVGSTTLVTGMSGQAFDSTGQVLGSMIQYESNFTNCASGPRDVAVPSSGAFLVGCAHPNSFALNDSQIRRVDATGAPVGSPIIVNDGTDPEREPVVIAGNNQYLVAWGDRRLGAYAVYAQRYDVQGSAIDTVPFVVRSSAIAMPSVAGSFDGTNYLIASQSIIDVYANRITPSGQVLDAPGLVLASTSLYGCVSTSFGATSHLVSWCDQSQGLRAKRVSTAGVVLDGADISVAAGTQSVSSAFDGTLHIVVFANGTPTVTYQAVSPGGTLVGSAVPLFMGNNGSVACAGGQCLISDGNSFATLSGASVSVMSPPAATGRIGLGANGMEFFLADVSSGDVKGAIFTAANPPVQIGPFYSVTQSTAPEVNPSIASVAPGQALVAYERPVPAENTARVFLRAILSQGPLGASCAMDTDCGSMHCADGVCCDQACGGSNPNDCMACSIAAGASADGTCGSVVDGHLCTGGSCVGGTCVPASSSSSSTSSAATSGSASSSASSTVSSTTSGSTSATASSSASTSTSASATSTTSGTTSTASTTGGSGSSTGSNATSGTTGATTTSSGAGQSSGAASGAGGAPSGSGGAGGGSTGAGCGCRIESVDDGDSADARLVLAAASALAFAARKRSSKRPSRSTVV